MKLHTEIIISSAHHLPNYPLKCKNTHGHNWRIVVEIDSDELGEYDMILDFTKIKEVVNELDHTDLNLHIENPTAENISVYLATKIKALGFREAYKGIKSEENRFNYVTVRVYEAENSYIEYTI